MTIAGVLIGLVAFGVGYNWLVGWLEQHDYQHGFVSLLVVAGVLVTLAGAALIVGLPAALWVAACFVCSGTPMIIGSIVRYVRRRADNARQALSLVMEVGRWQNEQ
jgi:hypothetical protein